MAYGGAVSHEMPSTEYNKAYYETNKERILKKNREYEKRRLEKDPEFRERKREQARKDAKRRRGKISQMLLTAKDTPCVDCGNQYPPHIMDFDHVRGEKSFNLAGAKGSRERYVSFADLEAEIAKCDVRCPTCHRLRHYREDVLNGRIQEWKVADDLWSGDYRPSSN